MNPIMPLKILKTYRFWSIFLDFNKNKKKKKKKKNRHSKATFASILHTTIRVD